MMNAGFKKTSTLTLMAGAIAGAICLAAAAVLAADVVEASQLRGKADTIFAFDRAHRGVLPAGKVRALSLAVQFHDKVGVEGLVAELKAGMER